MEKKRIIMYNWKAYNYKDIMETFRMMGHEVDVLTYHLENYDADETFGQILYHELQNGDYDCVFTVNYFAVIAEVCEKLNQKYIIWSCDNPLISMYHKSVFYSCNYIFLFDKSSYIEFKQMGVKHIFYLPLTANADRILQTLSLLEERLDGTAKSLGTLPGGTYAQKTLQQADIPDGPLLEECRLANDYLHEICFVGGLYERNTYDKIEHRFPDYLRGYLDGIIEAQLNISGGNIIEKMLTPDILLELETYFKLDKSPGSFSSLALIFSTTVLGFKVAARQRIDLLNMLSKKHQVSVYSNSNLNVLPFCEACGSVDYWTRSPIVFQKSKINLNFTIPNIRTGIPLRIWDVLASGGFLITNFQVELLDYFKPDHDLVIFESPRELEEKVTYYLEHEEERHEIAKNGQKKVLEQHSYVSRLQTILDTVFK